MSMRLSDDEIVIIREGPSLKTLAKFCKLSHIVFPYPFPQNPS